MTAPASRPPRRQSTVRRGVAVLSLAVLGACSGSDSSNGDGGGPGDAAGDGEAGGALRVEIEPESATTLELGEPLTVTVSAVNPGERGAAATIEVTLVAPGGAEQTVHRTTMFVPFDRPESESIDVTTSRWFTETGEFELRAEVVDPGLPATPGSLTFGVGESSRRIPVFADVTEQAGVVTDVPVPECGQFSNGAAWGDVDGDGWQDLLVTRLGEPVQLFVNRGDGTFAGETASRGIAYTGANGAAFADFDNDGDADLALVGDGPDALLRNDGTGMFEDVTDVAGVAGPEARGMSASWGDFDADGLLDLYVTNYMECTGAWTTEQEIIANVGYHPDVLYRNDGDGTFSDVTDLLPESDRTAAGFSAAWADVDGDQRLDLYLANDFVGLSPDHNRLWRNDGGGAGGWTFTDVSLESGSGLYMNTMGIGVADIDRDDDLDLALSNIGGNKLLRNDGDGTFTEEARTGIERPLQGIDYTTITWATVFYDFDLDGWEDLFMSAGNLQQAPDVVVGEQPNMLFLNDGTGQRFLDVSALTGIADTGESKGAAFADYDRDGDMDVFVVNQAGTSQLYRNDTPRADAHWLQVELVGRDSNRDGCGATVVVATGDSRMSRPVLCGSGGSGSSHQRAVHFGLGAAASVDRVEVRWPSGHSQVIDGVAADQLLVVEEAGA